MPKHFASRSIKKDHCTATAPDFKVTPISQNRLEFPKRWQVDTKTGTIEFVPPEPSNRASRSGRLAQQYRPAHLRALPKSASVYSPGEQDVRFYRNVETQRYKGQAPLKNIYYPPSESAAEPVAPTLYQTPGDDKQNMISTGTLVNPYVNETYETLVNQLPPPNTFQPILKSQLQTPNPRLIHMSGGINHHQPTLHRTEQCGSVFKPTSALGGLAPPGITSYAEKVTETLKKYASRDLFNNRNGDQPCERLIGEQPYGYVGLVPRVRIQPSVPNTQELNIKGRTTIPEIGNADLRKREEHTGEFFTRKAHVLVQRDIAPNTLINGTEAVSQIPIITDRLQKDGNTQGWLTPAFCDDLASYVTGAATHVGRITEGTTLATAGIEGAPQPGLQQQDPVKPSLKQVVMNNPLPVAAMQQPGTDGRVPATHLKAVPLKDALLQQPLPVQGLQSDMQAHVLATLQQLRATLKPQEQHPNPSTTQPLQVSVPLPTDALRPTLKPEQSLPIVSLNPINSMSYVPIEDIADTRRMSMPFATHTPAFDGERVGDRTPLLNLGTQQHRGTREADYIPGVSQIVGDSGGSGIRINGLAHQPKPRLDTVNYYNPEPVIGQQTPYIIPDFRLTDRHFREMQDLLDSQDGSLM